MFVKPATPDLLVAHPEARPPMPRHLPAEGAEVPDTEYWRRRLADGDVVPTGAPDNSVPTGAPDNSVPAAPRRPKKED